MGGLDLLDRIRVAHFRRMMAKLGPQVFAEWVRQDTKYWKSENEKGGMK